MAAVTPPEAAPWTACGRGRVPRAPLLLIAPALVALGFFFVVPYLNMLYISFMTQAKGAPYLKDFTVANYVEAATDPFHWEVILRTIRFGFVTTLLTLVMAYPIAYHLSRTSSRRKGILLTLLLSPLLVGVVIRSYGWMILLADEGLINQALRVLGMSTVRLLNNETGVLIGLVHIYLPFMVLSLAGSLQGIDPDLERAARSLGAGAWRTFWRVTWPLSLPGVVSGTVLVFVLTVSSYVVPALLGRYNVLTAPMLVVQMVMELFNWPLGSALAMLFFAVTVTFVYVYLKLMNRAMRGVL